MRRVESQQEATADLRVESACRTSRSGSSCTTSITPIAFQTQAHQERVSQDEEQYWLGDAQAKTIKADIGSSWLRAWRRDGLRGLALGLDRGVAPARLECRSPRPPAPRSRSQVYACGGRSPAAPSGARHACVPRRCSEPVNGVSTTPVTHPERDDRRGGGRLLPPPRGATGAPRGEHSLRLRSGHSVDASASASAAISATAMVKPRASVIFVAADSTRGAPVIGATATRTS